MILEARKFDPLTCNSALIIGKRGSGKTTLAKQLAGLKQPKRRVAVCPWPAANRDFCDPAYEGYENHEAYSWSYVAGLGQNDLFVLDDCFYDNEGYKDSTLNRVVWSMDGLRLIVTQSFPLETTPMLQSRLDCVFLLGGLCAAARKAAYNMYGQVFSSYEEFDSCLSQLTEEPYSAMVICNRGSTVVDSVFWHTAS